MCAVHGTRTFVTINKRALKGALASAQCKGLLFFCFDEAGIFSPMRGGVSFALY
ncbi:hypothetical protein KCP69_09415 [Salmonella enterica subsp. enterica]|nr:hypothetical protein KCP69_09415 [Salmonella enterica subsp. enterica]